MSFVEAFNALPLKSLLQISRESSQDQALKSMHAQRKSIRDFASLLSPEAKSQEFLAQMCAESQTITQRRFGKVIRMFAPLYVSNECVNNCKYCGFSRDNQILRVTLSIDEVVREAQELARQGFRNLLIVSGEHPKFVERGYLADCTRAVRPWFPSISHEVGPMEAEDYIPIVQAGAEGLVVYQETYDREIYQQVHTAGPKKHFDWRLETPERAYEAGFRRLGIGALHGLSDWRLEAISLAAHVQYLLKHCWKAQITISIPRLRPHAGDFDPLTQLSDLELIQLITAFRITFPDLGIVLSTREPAHLRDGLIPLGVTMISAGSHTEPGGYTGAGKDNLHYTKKGRIEALAENSSEWAPQDNRATNATGQFDIADERSPETMAALVRQLGYEPVWKDWDQALTASD